MGLPRLIGEEKRDIADWCGRLQNVPGYGSRGKNDAADSNDRHHEAFMYRTAPRICYACPVKASCTTSSSGRVVRRSIFQDYLDRARIYRTTPAYLKTMRKRAVWIEPLFGEANQWHQLIQFRLRCLVKVNIRVLLIAAGHNIKLRPVDYDELMEAADLIQNFRQYWDACATQDKCNEARRQLVEKPFASPPESRIDEPISQLPNPVTTSASQFQRSDATNRTTL
jgi:hypothetical protein